MQVYLPVKSYSTIEVGRIQEFLRFRRGGRRQCRRQRRIHHEGV